LSEVTTQAGRAKAGHLFPACTLSCTLKKPRPVFMRPTGQKWRRDRDSNPGRALTLAGFQDRCIQPLCHPSTAGNTTGNWFAVNGIMTHQVTFLRIGCFDCPRLTSMIQDMKGSSALQLLEPSTMQMQERH